MPKGVSNKQYTGEFKQRVVADMRESNLGYKQTAIKYEINSHNTIIRWERIHLEKGLEGLYEGLRGRASSLDSTNKGRPPELDKKGEEDLNSEV